MIAVFGEPKFLLKGEATFCADSEHWFGILDAEGAVVCSVPMNKGQAEMFLKQCRGSVTVISAADLVRKWINKADAK